MWLVPIFGVYFAVKLVRGGLGPESAGKVIKSAGLGLLAAVAIVLPVFLLTGDPNVSVSFGAAIGQQLGIAVASLIAVLIVRKAWPVFFRTTLSYAYASRIPVLLVMFIAMLGQLGNPLRAGPSRLPRDGLFGQVYRDCCATPNDLLGHVYHAVRDPVWWNCRCFAGIQGQ